MLTLDTLVSESGSTYRVHPLRRFYCTMLMQCALLLGIVPLNQLHAQTPAANSTMVADSDKLGQEQSGIFCQLVEQEPQFPGGTTAMRTYLQQNLRYPLAARRASITGNVYVSFVINVDGSLTDVKALRGLGFGTDEEAVRLVQAMPVWKPGTHSGKAVRMRYNLPVTFSL